MEPGINIIVGENNTGKSAVFRFISSVYYNLLTDYVQNGKAHAACQIKHGDNTILWRKVKSPKGGDAKTTYWLNGEPFTKVGRSQLTELHNFFMFMKLRCLGNESS